VDEINSTLDSMSAALQQNLPVVGMLLLILWGVHILNWMMHYRLNRFGIVPRRILSLPGIFLAPLLHGDFKHLLFNSIPFAVLAALVLMEGQVRFIHVTLFIIILSGSLTWLFGRYAIHIGASGLVLGYMGYLFANAYYQRSLMAIVLVVIMLYYFAALLMNLLPTDKQSSWEGHIFGFAAGLFTSYGLTALHLA